MRHTLTSAGNQLTEGDLKDCARHLDIHECTAPSPLAPVEQIQVKQIKLTSVEGHRKKSQVESWQAI